MINIQQQQGVVLVISLVFLALMTIVGVTAMQGTTQEEKMAHNAAQRGLAFQVAEAGLRAAEEFVQKMPRTTRFNNTTPGRRGYDAPGSLITPTTDIATFWLDNYEWKATDPADGGSIRWCDDPDNSDVCDTFSDDIKNEQRYVIERLSMLTGSSKCLKAPCEVELSNAGFAYRITARGTSGVSDAVVILQTIYHF